MLWAFFDESGKLADSDFMCLCGYIADDRWEEFSKVWRQALQRHRLPFVHTAALFNGKPPYEKLNWSEERRNAAMLDFINPIHQYLLAGFGIGLDAKFFRGLPKEDREILGDRSPERFLFHRIMRQVVDTLKVWNYVDPISVIFDAEDGFSVKCLEALIQLKKHRTEVRSLIGSIGFADDEIYYPIQAADMLAYATKRNLQGDPPAYFGALTIGIGSNLPIPYRSEFYDAETLNRTIAEIRTRQR